MSRIDDIFLELRSEGRAALMPFLTAGYPSLEVTARAIPAIEASGAAAIELGVPFSDPIADGPVIAGAMHEALQAGVTPRKVFQMVQSIRDATRLALIGMVSHSIVCRAGVAGFVAAAADAGLDGLIVPDIDLSQAALLRDALAEREMSFTLLVSPTTVESRVGRIVELCRGFVYLLARVGTTGARRDAPQIAARVEMVRRFTDLPVAVGFGISEPNHVAEVTRVADGAIVGSALVKRMGQAKDPAAAAADFVRDLAGGLSQRAASTGGP